MKKTAKKTGRKKHEEENVLSPEDYGDTSEFEIAPDTSVNPSQPEDRSEDLVNDTDPYIQDPEKDIHEVRREIRNEKL